MSPNHPLKLLSLVALLIPSSAFRSWSSSPRRVAFVDPRTSETATSATSMSDSSSPSSAAAAASPSSSSTPTNLGAPVCEYHQVDVKTTHSGPPRQAVSVEDLTPAVKELLSRSGMRNGVVNVISRHTTTAITINERESRLARDMEDYLLGLAPPDERSHSDRRQRGVRYLHNDIDARPESDEEAQRCRENGWDVDDPDQLRRWRDQEPINAHSHLLSMLLGSSESVPVVGGRMAIGQWQSLLLVDLDGPRDRTVGVQLLGYK